MSIRPSREPTAADAEADLWDVVVIGTGMGGATVGHALAARKRRVLFLERGTLGAQPASPWWPEPLNQLSNGLRTSFRHPIGCGPGGSSAVFGMVLERFRPADFEPRRAHPAAETANLPDAWPITYAELAPFYAQAERLFRVRGTADPLFERDWSCLPPPPATDTETGYLDALSACQLHPYRFHYACERIPGCTGCPETVCPRGCRNDAARICLRPALDEHGAAILAGCEVVKLEAGPRRVQSVTCRVGDVTRRIRARVFVLAANAFVSPLLLLRSASDNHPQGLGNSSGLVGRNLMLHVSDRVVLTARRKQIPAGAMDHGIGLNDYYLTEGMKLGNIHAHPFQIAREAVLSYLRNRHPLLARWTGPLLPAIASAYVSLAGRGLTFATIVEDLPYLANRVLPGEGIAYQYDVAPELRRRSAHLVALFARDVAARFRTRVLGATGRLNLSHPCGTCRFGDDPRTSVLDRHNRAHDLDNLYVADASFFPTSGGLNPSLTVAANALRIADHIARSV